MFIWEVSVKKDKGTGWYTTAGVFALALIIWGFLVGLYVMSIVIFIFVGVYILVENNAPEKIIVKVNENGIDLGGGFYDYPKIEEFSIVYDQGKAVILRLRMKARGLRHIDVDLSPDVNSAELRAYLSGYIIESENGGELTSTERLTRYLKI